MFMRYCGGGPGHLGHPTCTTAWKLHPSAPAQQVRVQTHDKDGVEGDSPSPPEGDLDNYTPGLSDSDIYLE
jgi:hypothetical protein